MCQAPERIPLTGERVMRGVVKGTIGQVKPRGAVEGCDQVCKWWRGGGQRVRLKRCTPAAAAETGCDYRAQINDRRDALAPLSQRQWRGRLLAL